jgi:hypothetical protein
MYFVFRDQYGNELPQLEGGWSDYSVYIYEEGKEEVDNARVDFDVSTYKSGLKFTISKNGNEEEDFRLLVSTSTYYLKIKATKSGTEYTNTYTVVMLGEGGTDENFGNGEVSVTESRVIINKDSRGYNNLYVSAGNYIYLIAGDQAELTLELRISNGKLIKRWYQDIDLKQAIKLTGNNIKEKDYSIQRGGVYGTYKIKFKRWKANYDVNADKITINIDKSMDVSSADNKVDLVEKVPIKIMPTVLDHMTLKDGTLLNTEGWMVDGNVDDDYYEFFIQLLDKYNNVIYNGDYAGTEASGFRMFHSNSRGRGRYWCA